MNIEINKTAHIDWIYPEIYEKGSEDYLEINLMHTRGSDGIRIKYDSNRDGFIIEQPVWEDDNITEWREVYFAQSWALEEEDE